MISKYTVNPHNLVKGQDFEKGTRNCFSKEYSQFKLYKIIDWWNIFTAFEGYLKQEIIFSLQESFRDNKDFTDRKHAY